jgi:hypothetical protein
MIYGINFRAKAPDTDSMGFPPGYAKKFAKTLRGEYRGFRLVGIGETQAEADAMVLQADNGHRKLHIEVRNTARGPLFGIYAG